MAEKVGNRVRRWSGIEWLKVELRMKRKVRDRLMDQGWATVRNEVKVTYAGGFCISITCPEKGN